MSTVMPEGQSVRNAVKWISENLLDKPEQNVQKLVHEAISRFDLSPKESELLIHFYSQTKDPAP